MIYEFLLNIEKSQAVTSPATKNLFRGYGSKLFKNDKAELFHTTVASGFSYEKYPDRTSSLQLLFYAIDWNRSIEEIKNY